MNTKNHNQTVLRRHCLNDWCDGPEWWGAEDISDNEYEPCPWCGYPCKQQKISVTPDNLLQLFLY